MKIRSTKEISKRAYEEYFGLEKYSKSAFNRQYEPVAENIIREAKIDLIADIEDSDIFKEHISKCTWWRELVDAHLLPIPVSESDARKR